MQFLLGMRREREDPCTVLYQEDQTNLLSHAIPHILATDAVLPECRSEILHGERSDRLAGTRSHLIKSRAAAARLAPAIKGASSS